ncbi:DEAD/DEAH box helicase family protein [Pseudomonas sp. 10B1]|uniref:type I restriction endonuclease subunit R n=1 Tax=unclassified Pseudomonas TaxID=196821 RepID=UPI002B23D9E2|nr:MULTISPECIES: DEAD/DEAH box helicase family protein [unclassified Pseudomonas]MEA9996282.1 DEAD/DEAH box helicase family protein [Pseudomonas sp. AA4]MEB0086676.1 DEAD/DEAH box helicase family protein [Pseudomonas sp. RTI1]MEB0124726.1 DEAD/DEAH box helicase family protein [Pseudomonas sp. CCC1.2]MEB0154990.1 DEAD/DEAH box helicase family protein [Pseudomonas sp. CCC4.3]MEB0217901.1 DEAD/DEAH box helicase family protein [Pseudomonas sp. AB12(2023)]
MADSKEAQFQQDIIGALAAQGWLVGTASGYDRRTALYTEDVLSYFKEAWPERWDKFVKANPNDPGGVLVQKLVRELEQGGTLDVLRHGFKLPAMKVELCSFQPDHGMNPDTLKRYQCNRLRVVPEVSYSPHAREAGSSGQSYNPRLDLVLFVNGIPTATLELKSQFKQSVENAKRQYRYDRPVKDPLTRKPEPLLTFKRGALVHFAVGQNEVAMTTKLAGKDTFFLPFNLGSEEGGAGNPMPADDSQYGTGYLWQRLLQPDAWLKVLGRFLHLDKKTSEGFDGTLVTKETMIFPRYHQWEVVNKLVNTTRAEGPGKRYLIQHSAGSGKSNSIAWTAHQLASLYDAAGQRLFNSVIVVTDRTVLDSQLQNTIYQFEHAQGVVKPISRDVGNQSKSEQLAEALAEQTRIIIVTIQTFPALFDALDKYPKLASGRYAVIADEAHSSQTGTSASKLKQILGSDALDAEEVSAEELLDAAVQARQPNERISYYAFTATPKAKTLELFGRPADPTLPASSSDKPEAFHLYSMRQAIEEGFILDVLRNYTTYSTAWKIANPDGEDDEVDSKKARIKLARWVRLHPYNISQKVEVIVEHFRANIRNLLNGQAKAMVVTSSRQEAVRYQLAVRAYVHQMGYNDVHPLVAFSGSVLPDEVIPEEVTESSSMLNPGLNGRDLAVAFDTQDFNVMIAANKYQTGFDQPKLCAMYVDKKLQGVDCVQTLSRLNRTFGDSKETFILDFFNEPQDILDAFLPYYTKAELTDVTDPQIIYDLQKKLDAEGIYHWQEVEAFAMAFFDPKAAASKLSYYCTPAKERFAKRFAFSVESRQQALDFKRTAEANGDSAGLKKAEHALKEAGEQIDQLDLFRKNLQSFVRLYEFLSQIVPYEDRELEQLCVYAKHLHPLLRLDRLQQDDVDVGELQLSHYRLSKRAEHQLRLSEEEGEYTLKPGSDVGSGKPHDPEKKRLSEIIEALNDIFGADTQDDDQLHFAAGITQRLLRQDDLMAQVNSHSVDQVMHGLLPKRVLDTVLDAMTDHEKLSLEVLDNETKSRAFALVILKMLKTAAGLEQSNSVG